MVKWGNKGRLAIGLLTVLCVVAVVFALQPPAGSSSPPASVSREQAGLLSSSAAPEASACDPDQPAQEVSADGSVVLEGEYESGIVIARIGQGNDAAAMTEALSQLTCLDGAAVSVTEADVQAGYVVLPLAPGANMADAVAALDDVRGVVSAQPNYLYHLLDSGLGGEEGAQLVAESASTGVDASANAGDGGGLFAGTALLDALAEVNDPDGNRYASDSHSWHLKSINAYDAWDVAKGEQPAGSAPRVTVAILDTGYDVDHEDLTDGAADGIGGNVVAAYDATVNDKEDYHSGVGDIDGHGTHVAGIVAAITNNEKGVAGVSYNARILPIQVFHTYMDGSEEKHGASSLSVKAAYDYVCEHAEEYNIRVANMSLGASQTALSEADKLVVSAVDEAWAKGVLTVCAAGNGAANGPYRVFPGDYLNHGMNVIALTAERKKASYSNYNLDEIETYKDIAAPGSSIYSTVDPTFSSGMLYGNKSGTSMASPVVAGVAALLFSVTPQLSPDDVIDILHVTARDLTPGNSGDANTKIGFDQYTGYGEVDAETAVVRAGKYLMGDSTLLVGGTLTLTPTGSTSTDEWEWESSDDGIATVENGVVTGVAGGKATITAVSGDVVVTKSITVFDISFAIIEAGLAPADLVIPEEVEVGVGEELYLWFNENPNTGLWLIGSSDYGVMTASVPDNDNIVVEGVAGGEAYVEATLKENPKLAVRLKVIVHDADNPFLLEAPRAEVEWPDGPWTYTSQAIEPAPTVKFTHGYRSNAHAETLEPETDYKVEYADNIEPGTATATVVGLGRFAGSLSHEFAIGRANLQDAAVTATGWKWDGAVHDPQIGVKLGDASLAADGNWMCEVRKGGPDGQVVAIGAVLDPGEYTVVVTGTGRCDGTATAKFTVEEPDPVKPDDPDDPDQPGNPDQPDNPAKPDSPDQPDNPAKPDSPTTPDNPSQPGKPTEPAKPTEPSNPDSPAVPDQPANPGEPDPAQPETQRISLANAVVKLAQARYEYDGSAHAPAVVSVTLPSGKAVAAGGYTVAYSDNVEAGTAMVTVTGRGNYTGSASCTFEITHHVSAASFADFEADAWYLRESPGEGAFTGEGSQHTLYVDYIVANGIMSGYDDGSGRFGVYDQMTRGQLVTVLYRAATGETAQTTDNNVKPRFSDTPKGMYYSRAVKWATDNDIVTGYAGSDRFGPDDPVTREQMATLVHRFAKHVGADMTPSASLAGYSDWRSVSSWARFGMSYCVAIRAMGYGGTTLNPQDNASRIQAAKVVAVILHDVVHAT